MLRCILEVSEALEEANSASKCLTLSQRFYVLCIRLRLWMRRIHRFSILGTHISSAKRRAGACALFGFALGTQSSRAKECSVSTSLVYGWDHPPFEERCSHAAWQQIICNADRAVLERLARDPGRTTQVLSCSRILTSILAIRSASAFDVPWFFAFILHGYRATYVSLFR